MHGRLRWWLAVRPGLVFVLIAVVGLFGRGDTPERPEPPSSGELAVAADQEQVKPTQTEAVVAAKRTNRPVEIAAFRGERREVWANPDGTFTDIHHLQPVRTLQQGKWVPVDPSLVRYPDGSVGPRAAVIGLRLSGGGDGLFATVERAGRRLSLSWPGRLPEPTLHGDRATYPDVLPGVDLVVHVSVSGFSHVLVVKTPEAARHPQVTELSYGLHTEHLTLSIASNGGLVATDPATGGAVFEAPAPLMWDSGEPGQARSDPVESAGLESRVPPASARQARLGMRVQNNRLYLTPDPAMLTDPSTRFPVYLDPFVQATSNTAWAMVDSGYPNEEYWKFDGRRDERIGYCPIHTGECNNSKVKRLFYAIPTPYQDDRISILEASFRITMVHTYDGSPRKVSLYRTGGISSATNWNNQPGGASWSGAVRQDTLEPTAKQSSCTTTNQNVEFTATAAVREAATHNWGTTTFGIRADNESDYRWVKRFCDNAVLSVTYNRAPDQPAVSDLSMNPGGSCVSGSARPYVSSVPTLSAILRDPDTGDAEPLTAEFKVTWTPPGGSLQTKTWVSPAKDNGSTFSYNLADVATGVPNLPENVIVSWEVRAGDGTTWGPWSSDGPANPCEFILDKTQPAGPDIDSAEFLPADATDTTPACVEDETWYDGVGRYGTFTFDSAATDVYKYEYGFDSSPSPANALFPATDGGPVSVTWLAQTEGPHTVQVRAVDRSGKTSDISTCVFRVAAGAPPVAEWSMADDADSTAAADSRGTNQADAGAGVIFAVPGPGGAADRAVHLTGADDSYLATDSSGLIDTANAFAVSAWVKLADDTRDQVAVSQDGSGEPGFILGFDATAKRWALKVPSMDVDSLGGWSVLGPTAVKDEWTHLVGVHDPVARTLTLYVNAGAPVTAERRSVWKSRGGVQIGRRLAKSGHTDHWNGDLADVTVFNRIVTHAEVPQMYALKPVRQGYWELDEATVPDDNPTVKVSREYSGDETRDLTLYNGADVYAPDVSQFPPPEYALVGAGHLVLDGIDDYAATAVPIAQTDGSFTVTARVRLASECTKTMTVLSQPGDTTSAFFVRCGVVGGVPRWDVVMPDQDGPGSTIVFDNVRAPNTDSAGQHLALTYDAFRNEMRLYVEGQLASTAVATNPNSWHADGGGLQVGRAWWNSTWVDYFAGVIDEVRVYTGVLDQTTVQRLASRNAQPDL